MSEAVGGNNGGYNGGYNGGIFTSTGAILVLFILLVIVSKTILY